MLKNILFILLFLTSFQVFSQGKVGYYVKVINKVTGKKEPGATVKVYEGSTLTQTVTVPNSAQTVIDLNEGKKYKIEISKDGKVSRFFYVDLTTYSDEGHQGDPLQGETEIGLFDKQPGVDYSYIENNEITTFKYDGSATLALDQAKAQKMGQKIDEIINKAANDQKNTDANYSKLVSEADGMYTLKKYEDALKKYEAASLLKPAEQHPIQRINEISAILKSQKEANAANAQKDVEYNSLIKSADAFRDQKKYDEAISKYTEALSKKADEYPKTQIENCKSLKENAAKAEEIEKNYQAAMSTAQVFVGQKSWSAAKDKYKEALKLKPNDPVATQKLADVMVKLDDQKKEQDKKKIFQQLSDEGDALFTQEKWVEAKAKYTEALKIEPASTYLADKMKDVNAKLAEIEAANAKKAQIDKLLAEGKTAIDAKQFPTAKTKYEE
ncbi:MAG: tetratricopeptide repeat protein, partial [Fluviicola sp.]